MSYQKQQVSILHRFKMITLMLAAAVLAVAPMMQLAVQARVGAAAYGISLTATVNKHVVEPGEKFTITFQVKNTGSNKLNDVKLDNWSPSRLNFEPFTGNNGASATANTFKLSFGSFNGGAERTYSVKTDFKAGVEDGKGIDSMPRITANKVGANGRVSDAVNAIGITVKRASNNTNTTTTNTNNSNNTTASNTNNNLPAIGIAARVLDVEQQNKTSNYHYGARNPKQVAPGKWFKIQFTIRNNKNKDLKNIKLDWAPSRLIFPSNSKGNGNGITITAKKVQLRLDKLSKKSAKQYVVYAKFVSDASEGETLHDMPKITAQLDGVAKSDKVDSINIVAKAADTTVVEEEDPPEDQQADDLFEGITILKSASVPMPKLNEPFTYTITVKNDSEKDFGGFMLVDQNSNPKVQQFESVTVTGAKSNTGTKIFDSTKDGVKSQNAQSVITVAPGATTTMTINAKIVADTPEAEEIVNQGLLVNPLLTALVGWAKGDIESTYAMSEEISVALCKGDCLETPRSTITTEQANKAFAGMKGYGSSGNGSSNSGGMPFEIAKTGPAEATITVIAVAVLGYGGRRWIASRHARIAAYNELYGTSEDKDQL